MQYHTGYEESTVTPLRRTVLCPQAVTGHEESVEALLQHNASFLVRDCKGRTPVHLAAACGHIGVLGGLLHAAQSVETLPVLTDNQGYTPLHWACYNGTEMRGLKSSMENIQYSYEYVYLEMYAFFQKETNWSKEALDDDNIHFSCLVFMSFFMQCLTALKAQFSHILMRTNVSREP